MIENISEGSESRVFSIDKVADLLSLSPWTIRKWISDGKLKSCKLGARRMVPASEVTRMIVEGTAAANPNS